MNAFDEVRAAVDQAKSQLAAVDSVCNNMAHLLKGRLRNVSGHVLRDLKRELADFDANRRVWKEHK